MSVEVVVEDTRWVALERLAARAIPAALAHLPEGWEVAVLGCDDTRIAALNGAFREVARPTNVLSWPSEARDPDDAPGAVELGDVAISYDTCAREAAEQGKPFDAHVTHLLVHAVLHLLGHDHEREDDALRMEALEARILDVLGFPDPYRADTMGPTGN